MTARDWLAHAFALDGTGTAGPDPAQRDVVEHLAREVVRRHLTQPALVALEVCGPLNFVSAQGLHFFQPIIASFADTAAYDSFARFLEQRGAVDYIRDRIEALEADCVAKESPPTP